ncbi:hypothetical protein Ciccas_004646, partial [Cichlidogyrus casuarinus]
IWNYLDNHNFLGASLYYHLSRFVATNLNLLNVGNKKVNIEEFLKVSLPSLSCMESFISIYLEYLLSVASVTKQTQANTLAAHAILYRKDIKEVFHFYLQRRQKAFTNLVQFFQANEDNRIENVVLLVQLFVKLIFDTFEIFMCQEGLYSSNLQQALNWQPGMDNFIQSSNFYEHFPPEILQFSLSNSEEFHSLSAQSYEFDSELDIFISDLFEQMKPKVHDLFIKVESLQELLRLCKIARIHLKRCCNQRLKQAAPKTRDSLSKYFEQCNFWNRYLAPAFSHLVETLAGKHVSALADRLIDQVDKLTIDPFLEQESSKLILNIWDDMEDFAVAMQSEEMEPPPESFGYAMFSSLCTRRIAQLPEDGDTSARVLLEQLAKLHPNFTLNSSENYLVSAISALKAKSLLRTNTIHRICDSFDSDLFALVRSLCQDVGFSEDATWTIVWRVVMNTLIPRLVNWLTDLSKRPISTEVEANFCFTVARCFSVLLDDFRALPAALITAKGVTMPAEENFSWLDVQKMRSWWLEATQVLRELTSQMAFDSLRFICLVNAHAEVNKFHEAMQNMMQSFLDPTGIKTGQIVFDVCVFTSNMELLDVTATLNSVDVASKSIKVAIPKGPSVPLYNSLYNINLKLSSYLVHGSLE